MNKRERSFDATESVLFLFMLIEMPSHVRTVKAVLSIACHLPNPFTNEYQSED